MNSSGTLVHPKRDYYSYSHLAAPSTTPATTTTGSCDNSSTTPSACSPTKRRKISMAWVPIPEESVASPKRRAQHQHDINSNSSAIAEFTVETVDDTQEPPGSPFDILSDELLVRIIVKTSFNPSIYLVSKRWHNLYFSCFMLTERAVLSLERRFQYLAASNQPYSLIERSNLTRQMFVRLHHLARSRNCSIDKMFEVSMSNKTSGQDIATSTLISNASSILSSTPLSKSTPASTTTSTTTSTSSSPSTSSSSPTPEVTSSASSLSSSLEGFPTNDPIYLLKQRLARLRYPSIAVFPKSFAKHSPFTLLKLDYSPYGIAIDDAQSNLYVVDSDYDRVLVYNINSHGPTTTPPDGNPSDSSIDSINPMPLPITVDFVRELSVKGCPTGVAFSPANGNLIISCRGDQAIREFDPKKGILIRHYQCGAHDAVGRRGLSDLRGVAVDAEGSCVYVADYLNNRIQVFSNSGNLVKVLEEPLCHALDLVPMPNKNQLLASNYINHCLEVFDLKSGKWLYRFGSFGSSTAADSEGKLNYPNGIAIDPVGNILVCDTENHRIQIFDDQGRWLHSFGSRGCLAGQFEIPHSIASSSDSGFIYIGENGNQRIQIV